MEPEAMWLLYSGVNLIATKLSRTAFKLEQGHQRLSSEADRSLVRPRIQDVYAMVDEASKLLPLFRSYADTLASGPADAPATGFQSLPTDVQQKILALAATNNDTTAALRRVSRSFEAHTWTAVRSRTTIDLDENAGGARLSLLPYLPHLAAIRCSSFLDLPSTRFADAILTAQLPALRELVSLQLAVDDTHFSMFPQQLPSASHLTHLRLDRDFQGADIPGGDWPHALALALPQLQNLQSLILGCTVPPGCPEPHLCQHLSALTRLTCLMYQASTSDNGGTAAFARGLSGLTSLRNLQLDDWPSSSSAADRSAWRALMGSIGSLHSLDTLRLVYWDVDDSSSAAYFSELAPTLTSLRVLGRLTLSADAPQTAPNPDAAASNTAAGASLVQAIGSQTQLRALEIRHLAHVGASACCQHLASLTNLTSLNLQLLGVTQPPVLEAPDLQVAPGGTLEQLLRGMTQLEGLTLHGVGLNGQSALRVFLTVVPMLVHLQDLLLNGNHLGVAPVMVLASSARQLPALRSVAVGWGNDLVEPGDGVPGTIEDLNLVAGRVIVE